MTELKVASCFELEKVLTGKSNKLFYSKSEADKVIRRQKYKRCLNMAKWCFTKSNYHYIVGREEGGRFAKDNFRRSNLYSNWWQRWLKIAEQFKEAK